MVDTINKEGEEVDVLLTLSDEGKRYRNIVDNAKVPGKNGTLVALKDLLSIENRKSISSVQREDAARIVEVFADVKNDVVTSQKVNDILRSNLSDWEQNFPV